MKINGNHSKTLQINEMIQSHQDIVANDWVMCSRSPGHSQRQLGQPPVHSISPAVTATSFRGQRQPGQPLVQSTSPAATATSFRHHHLVLIGESEEAL